MPDSFTGATRRYLLTTGTVISLTEYVRAAEVEAALALRDLERSLESGERLLAENRRYRAAVARKKRRRSEERDGGSGSVS